MYRFPVFPRRYFLVPKKAPAFGFYRGNEDLYARRILTGITYEDVFLWSSKLSAGIDVAPAPPFA